MLIYSLTFVCVLDVAFLECPMFKCLDGYMCHLYHFAIPNLPIASEVALCGFQLLFMNIRNMRISDPFLYNDVSK